MKNLIVLCTVACFFLMVSAFAPAQQGDAAKKQDDSQKKATDTDKKADAKDAPKTIDDPLQRLFDQLGGGIIGGQLDPEQIKQMFDQIGGAQFEQLQKLREQLGKGQKGGIGGIDPAQMQKLLEQFGGGKGGITIIGGKINRGQPAKAEPAAKADRIDHIVNQLEELRKDISSSKDSVAERRIDHINKELEALRGDIRAKKDAQEKK